MVLGTGVKGLFNGRAMGHEWMDTWNPSKDTSFGCVEVYASHLDFMLLQERDNKFFLCQ